MILQMAEAVYTLSVTPDEREQLLVAVEYARAMRLGDLDAAGMLLDLDSERLDRLADGVFLAGVPS
jgi:hypothetical protein